MSKVLVITGASSGIGKAAADFFSKKGFNVVGVSRKVPKDISYDYYPCDVSIEAEVVSTVKKIEEKYGVIDILVNCAGMGVSGAVEYATYDDIKKIFEVNVYGVFLFSKQAIPLLRKSSKPKIINIGSVAGDLTIPFQTFYSMSKASVHVLSEGLRMELKPFGIDVSAVLPGDTKTGFTAAREQPHVLVDDYYKDRIKKSIARMEHDEQNGKSPMSVVKVIHKLIKRKSMPVKVTVGFEYKVFVFLKRVLPKRFENWILYIMYGK
ncbi:MAG: SDR family NAD(P)-dependent oxidoreductase [Candidatus Izemoplasmatales bacterium]